ncbi:MAG: QueT transporter family protein [Clostridiales bacterium]|nr:QueT transporter family protein [Clostridiales bacterium]
MFKKLLSTRSLCVSAVIAALYAALTMLLRPISFGSVQLRISESLTLLPVLMPQAIPGLFVGCLIANLFSPVGVLDIIFGSLATLIAACGTWYFRRMPILAAACPVVANGVIIGLLVQSTSNWPLPLTMCVIALEEAVSVALGFALIAALKRIDLSKLI